MPARPAYRPVAGAMHDGMVLRIGRVVVGFSPSVLPACLTSVAALSISPFMGEAPGGSMRHQYGGGGPRRLRLTAAGVSAALVGALCVVGGTSAVLASASTTASGHADSQGNK